MRSSIKMTSVFGFPLLNCKGVTHLIGLPISVDGYFPTVFVADLFGVDSDFSSPFFIKASA
jgi:hypothetical protein